MAHRVFFDLDGDWDDMVANNEFVEADTLPELIAKIQAEGLDGNYTAEMSFDQLAEELEENGYAIDPV